MDVRTWPLSRRAATDLASRASFVLGPIRVDPPTRRLAAGSQIAMVEPRVMRVLIALGEEPGRVLSRDELIDLCWDGQIVSDKAINRAIALLRQALEEVGGGAVILETITKVGFRIVVAGHDEQVAVPASSGREPIATAPVGRLVWTRRAVAAGVVATGAGAALAYAAWNRPAPHVPDPQALDLYRRGQMTQKLGLPGGMQQAMSYYKQATAADPGFADAWGALAIAYKHAARGFMKGPQDAYPRLMASAARRALALDPDQPDALMALTDFRDRLGSWQADEAKLRGLVKRAPNYWYGLALLDLAMQDVGRFAEAVSYRKQSLERDSAIPVSWAMYARGLHYANRDHEADAALDRAFARWPAHQALWAMRYHVLIGGKRFAEAAAFARDPRSMPDDLPQTMSAQLAAYAEALATKSGLDAILAKAAAQPVQIEGVPAFAPLTAAAGDVERLFALLEAYYFGGPVNGQAIPPPDGGKGRSTAVLFAPPVIALRGDARWGKLLERTGLEDYWRKSGTRPDFRRG